jgi:hypothetical protein
MYLHVTTSNGTDVWFDLNGFQAKAIADHVSDGGKLTVEFLEMIGLSLSGTIVSSEMTSEK